MLDRIVPNRREHLTRYGKGQPLLAGPSCLLDFRTSAGEG
jgi:hypothetical protein